MATETKQTASFIICGRLSGLNEYTRKCRSNKYAGAKMKEQNEQIVKQAINMYNLQDTKFEGKVHIIYRWYEETKRRDLDNIAFAKKFIQDALVDVGVLQGDSWKYIAGFTDEFYIDKDTPRIEVIIREV